MAIKRVWIGSTGPFLFDRSLLIPEDQDAIPLLNINQAPLVFETEAGDIITIDAAISDLEIALAAMEPLSFFPASMTVNTGTLDAGVVGGLQAVGGTDVTISETTGTDPLRVTFDFTGVTKLSNIVFYGYYAGGSGHQISIELYNNSTTNWDQFGVIGTDTLKKWYSFPVFNTSAYINSGAVSLRFNHIQNGVASHDLILDLLELSFGGASGSASVEASTVVYTPSGGLSATNVASALNELDSEKQATLISGSNIRTVNGNTLLGSTDLIISGSISVTQVEVDLGSTGKWSEDFTITDAAVTGTSKILASVAALATSNNDADEIATSGVMAIPGAPSVGSFIMSVIANDGPISGKFLVNYTVG